MESGSESIAAPPKTSRVVLPWFSDFERESRVEVKVADRIAVADIDFLKSNNCANSRV